MSRATPRMRELAERLIAHETKANKSAGATIPAACLISEKLRPHLATLMGNLGFRSLLSRALALANADIPWMRAVHVNAAGSFEGLDGLAAEVEPDELLEGCAVLLAQLLGLLVAFIGEDLTLQLMREVWPKLFLEEGRWQKGDK